MLLDCGGGSCSGGSLTGGYKVIEKEHGVASQSDYPYSAHEGKKTYYLLMRNHKLFIVNILFFQDIADMNLL